MAGLICEHVYKNMDTEICPLCAQFTHDINWTVQNKLQEEWKMNNPDAGYIGWTSI